MSSRDKNNLHGHRNGLSRRELMAAGVGGVALAAGGRGAFAAGADKIAINSAAVKDPTLIGKIAARFGSQAVVVAIDADRKSVV